MRWRALSLLLPAAAVIAAAATGGCSHLGYYAQSVRGHLDLMSRREPIEELLDAPGTSSALRERLELVLEIRRFASDELGLPDNASYRSYADLERPYVVWNVFAAPEFSLQPRTWCFLFVGCVSYRGYFHEEKARGYAGELAAQGDDVYVGGVAAYSTLGRFADPVLNTMMRGDETYLAGLIFHELSHQQLYVKGETAFNEAFATTVEEEGLRRWLESRGHAESFSGYRERRRRQREFTALVAQTRAELRELYASELDESSMRGRKERAFERMRGQYARLREQWGGYSGYDDWFAAELNNAKLSSVATYRELVPAFRALLQQAGGDLEAFYASVRELGRAPDAERAERLRELMAVSDRRAGESDPAGRRSLPGSAAR